MNQDISLNKKFKQKKLSTKKQYQLVQLLHNLTSSGFNLTEVVAFLDKGNILEDCFLMVIKTSLLGGNSLAYMIEQLGYPDSIVTQISLADIHGNTSGCLEKVVYYLEHMTQVKKKTIEVITYPIILMCFLIAIMFGLRQYLLPQMEQNSYLTHFISYFPLLCLVFLISLGIMTFLLVIRWRRKSQLQQLKQFSRIPILKEFIRLYTTAYFASEWGNLMEQGLELSSIVNIMSSEKSLLVREIGQEMKLHFLEGGVLHEKVLDYPFFQKELSLMIEYGDIKAKLGQELEIYAKLIWERFFSKLLQATQLIQPIIFLIVALIIVLIYAAMLLPMYHSIGGSL